LATTPVAHPCMNPIPPVPATRLPSAHRRTPRTESFGDVALYGRSRPEPEKDDEQDLRRAPAPSPQRGQDNGRLDPQSRTGPGRDHHRLRLGAGADDGGRRGRRGDARGDHRGRGDVPGRSRAEAHQGPEPVTSAVSTAAARTASGPGPRGAHRALLPLGTAAAGIALALILQVVFDPFRTDIP